MQADAASPQRQEQKQILRFAQDDNSFVNLILGARESMDRRKFVQATAAASGLLLLKPETVFGYQANSAVRLGLLGCGNRGTSVATSFAENTSAQVVALGDMF